MSRGCGRQESECTGGGSVAHSTAVPVKWCVYIAMSRQSQGGCAPQRNARAGPKRACVRVFTASLLVGSGGRLGVPPCGSVQGSVQGAPPVLVWPDLSTRSSESLCLGRTRTVGRPDTGWLCPMEPCAQQEARGRERKDGAR